MLLDCQEVCTMLLKQSHLFHRENQVHQARAGLHKDGDLSQNQVKELSQRLKQDPVK